LELEGDNGDKRRPGNIKKEPPRKTISATGESFSEQLYDNPAAL